MKWGRHDLGMFFQKAVRAGGWFGQRADLAQEPEAVVTVPAFDDLAVRHLHDDDSLYGNLAASRRDAKSGAGVGAFEGDADCDAVAVGEEVVDADVGVGNGAAN